MAREWCGLSNFQSMSRGNRMSVIIDSLKKQNTFLQGEIERFATAVDELAARLASTQAQLAAHQPQPEFVPASTDNDVSVIDAEAMISPITAEANKN
ncbi:MAG: hypothetical protein KGI75_04150 [Rhizobiaceae bacterium]|nr:hypothetical protein [Rhizobiaceae bacterium]